MLVKWVLVNVSEGECKWIERLVNPKVSVSLRKE